MKVVMVLALLLLGLISHEVEGGGDSWDIPKSEEEDLELERELSRWNKPAIKSFQACCSYFLEFHMLYIFCFDLCFIAP